MVRTVGMSSPHDIVIGSRFRGPPQSGNGGYTAGVLAAFVSGEVQVTLRAPPPLDTALTVQPGEAGKVALFHGSQLVAEAQPTQLTLSAPPAVSHAEAAQASARFPGFAHHPYPGCFVCGTERAHGDGLRLFPGPSAQEGVAAAPFEVDAALCDDDGLLEPRLVWSALDCPSWWGYASFAQQTLPILLGRLSARVLSRPARGEPCAVQGWALAREGRRILCGSALYGAEGQVYAMAQATWIEVKS